MIWQLEEYRFDPATNVLTGPGGPVLLEPKPSSLLAFFISNPGRDISRDELIEQVWAGQIVSDGAINRVVVQLRKALGDDGKIKRFIVTVPKVGYRFVAKPSLATVSKPKAPAPGRRVVMVPLAGLALFAILWLALFRVGPPPTAPAMTIAPLVRLSTEQFDAAPSPNSEQLIYSQKTETGAQLYWRRSPDSDAVSVGAAGGRASDAAWAPDGRRIAYQFTNAGSCEIHLLAISDNFPADAETLHTCPPGAAVSLAFSADGEKLYLTESASPQDPSVLFALNLASGALTQPAQPVPRGRGNHQIDIHPETGKILILNDESPGRTSAFMLDPATGSFERLQRWSYRVDHALWGHRSGTIVHPGGHPSYDLIETAYEDGSAEVLVSDSRRITSPRRMANGRDYLFTSYLFNRDIWVDGAPAPELNSSVMDYMPALSRDGSQLAFISKRTGDSRVWVHEFASGSLRSFSPGRTALSIVGLDWSFDDTKLLVTSSQGLWVIEAASGEMLHHIDTRLPAYAAVWIGPETIGFSQRENGRWQRYEVKATGIDLVRSTDGRALTLSSDTLTISVDQRGLIWQGDNDFLAIRCKTAIRNRHLTYLVRGESFFCPAPQNNGVIEWRLGAPLAIAVDGVASDLQQFSIGGKRTAHTVEAGTSSDIMRTVSDTP